MILDILVIMIFGSAAAVLYLLCSPVLSASAEKWPSGNGNSSLNYFVATEKKIALQGVLNNIGPDGSKVAGAGNYVVASPSKVDPDCETFPIIFISWVILTYPRFLHLD